MIAALTPPYVNISGHLGSTLIDPSYRSSAHRSYGSGQQDFFRFLSGQPIPFGRNPIRPDPLGVIAPSAPSDHVEHTECDLDGPNPQN